MRELITDFVVLFSAYGMDAQTNEALEGLDESRIVEVPQVRITKNHQRRNDVPPAVLFVGQPVLEGKIDDRFHGLRVAVGKGSAQQTFVPVLQCIDVCAFADQTLGFGKIRRAFLKRFQQRARIIYEYTDYAIFGGFLKGSKLGTTGVFAGYDLEEWFYILVSDPDYANELFHATAEAAVENLKLYLDACGEYMDILMMSTSDYGTQRGPMISPEVFNRVYVPNYRIMNDYVHEHSKVKTFFHSCGSIRTLLNGFIDAHVDAINPVQLSALNMNPKELKEEFGKRIVFWGGGIDTQDVLPNGSVDEVREHVKNNLLTFKEGGNYVFNTVHNIQALVPPQNIEAMLETVMEYGKYE